MSEQDQNIENFFRKRLGGPSGGSSGQKEYAYSEADWSLLEAKLDALPVPPSSPVSPVKWIVISGILVVVSFFAGWYLKEVLSETKAQRTPPIESTGPAAVATAPTPSPEETDESLAPRRESATFEELREESTESDALTGGSASSALRRFNASMSPAPASDTGVPVGLAEAERDNSGTLQNVPSMGMLSSRQAETLSQVLAPREAVQLVFLPYAPGKPEEDSKRSFGKLAVGAGFSPDFSTVGPAPDFRQPGVAFGALIDYRLGTRWKLSSGVYKSNKQYVAGKGDYTPPSYGGWPGGVEPASTDATCGVLDVPFTAGFMALQGSRTAFWINGGFSSYWMLSEAYYYHYDVEGGSRPWGWRGENENKHLLSVASFSVSIEKFVSRRLSIQVEPFIKVPLAGVGHGKVKLYTTGSFVSVKYHFLTKNL